MQDVGGLRCRLQYFLTTCVGQSVQVSLLVFNWSGVWAPHCHRVCLLLYEVDQAKRREGEPSGFSKRRERRGALSYLFRFVPHCRRIKQKSSNINRKSSC